MSIKIAEIDKPLLKIIRVRFVLWLSCYGVLLMGYLRGEAVPQYAVRYGQTCGLCHINPTGGGMRNLYGAQFFSYMDLPWKELDDFSKLEEFNPQFGRHFQMGADFRGQYYFSNRDEEGNSFLTMQGDLYVTIAPIPQVLFYLDRGLYGGFESFVLIQGLPYGAAARVGRFVPGFGWRFVDHKSFTRVYSQLGLRGEEDGVEIGMYAMPSEFSLAITNGKPQGVIDPDRGKRIYGRGAIRYSLWELNFTTGLSSRWGELPLGKGSEVNLPRNILGSMFLGINWKMLTYLWEINGLFYRDKWRELTAANLLNIKLRRGWETNISYDFRDPDLKYSSGTLSRIRLATEIYLSGYLSVSVGGERNKDQNGKLTYIGETMLHFWF